MKMNLKYWLYRMDYCFCSFMVSTLDKMIIKGAINNELLIYYKTYFKKHLDTRKYELDYLKVKIEVIKNIDLFLAYKVVFIEVLREDRFMSEFIYSCIYYTLLSYAKEKGINGFDVVLVYSNSYDETFSFMSNLDNKDNKVMIVSRLNSYCNASNKRLFFKDFDFKFVYRDCCMGVDNENLGLKCDFDYILI